MKNIVVIYHKDCPDGFGAAWAAWKKLGRKAEYIGTDPGILPKIKLKNKVIYFVDNGLDKREDILNLKRDNKKVVIIDHHVSRKQVLALYDDHHFSLGHSGSVLAWKYFYPQKQIPKLLRYIENYDLGRFHLRHTMEVMAVMDTYEDRFPLWDKIVAEFEKAQGQRKYIKEGAVALRVRKMMVSYLVEGAKDVLFEGYRTLAVNSAIWVSDIGRALILKKPPISIIWSERGDKIRVSLRSNSRVDVLKIAKKFGGGGHKQAAGFRLKTNVQFPWKTIEPRKS